MINFHCVGEHEHVDELHFACFKASLSAKAFIWKLQGLVHLHVNKTNFHMKGFALGLVLKQRRKATRKSPIQFPQIRLCI